MNDRRRPKLELVGIDGGADELDRDMVLGALEDLIEHERRERVSSIWLRSSRSQGRRLGMLDYRDRFSREDAWRLSSRFPFGGREYPGLNGRGDAK
ncbi:MAG: hypothetical protein ABR575_02240 [Actinomycetota bacterium]